MKGGLQGRRLSPINMAANKTTGNFQGKPNETEMVNDPSVQFMPNHFAGSKQSRPELSIIMSDNKDSNYAHTFGQSGFHNLNQYGTR